MLHYCPSVLPPGLCRPRIHNLRSFLHVMYWFHIPSSIICRELLRTVDVGNGLSSVWWKRILRKFHANIRVSESFWILPSVRVTEKVRAARVSRVVFSHYSAKVNTPRSLEMQTVISNSLGNLASSRGDLYSLLDTKNKRWFLVFNHFFFFTYTNFLSCNFFLFLLLE